MNARDSEYAIIQQPLPARRSIYLTRKSCVVCEEDGKYPNVILEILSPTTANTDREYKKEHYQNSFRTPEY